MGMIDRKLGNGATSRHFSVKFLALRAMFAPLYYYWTVSSINQNVNFNFVMAAWQPICKAHWYYFLALRYRYRSGDSISHTQCLSFVVVVCPLHIFANSSFIFHPILLKFYRHVQNDLAHKRKFSKTCFWVKKNS